MRHKQILLGIIILSCTLFTSCKLWVIMEPESEESIKLAAQMPDYVPLSADKLKQKIIQDTTHYKFIVFYGVWCDSCLRNMQEVYPKIAEKIGFDKVKWYFILRDTGSIEKNEQFLNYTGYSTITRYYLRDDDPRFNAKNTNFLNNLTNYIFEDSLKVDDLFGTPVSYIVSKDNRLKKSVRLYKDGTKRIASTDMYYILDKSLEEIDFDKIDTLYFDWKPIICYPDGTCE